MSQSPSESTEVSADHPYAQAAQQLNRLVRLGHSFSGNERNCSFLNIRGGRFANLSAVSGIDFVDDGRAIAAADWDFDGDLDFWVANRTGPQLRWLRNDLATENHFVAVRLVGTQSNRDAIGATTRLFLAGEKVPLIRSLRAGEGFLAQGSKWLHFGLGDSAAIERLEIRWPTGQVEQVRGLEVDRFHTVTEGSGKCEPWTPPSVAAVRPNPQDPNRKKSTVTETDVTQLRLSMPASLPPLRYHAQSLSSTPVRSTAAPPATGEFKDASQTAGSIRLINLWATWCPPCLVELKTWTDHEAELRGAGLEILALSVDALSPDNGADTTASENLVQQTLQKIGFPFSTGIATSELLDVLQLVNNTIYRDDHRRLPVPTSLLVDQAGNLAAIYKGPVAVERLLADVQQLALTDQPRPAAVSPFPGQWIGLPGPHPMAKLVDSLWEQGMEAEAQELADRLPLAEGDDQRLSTEKVKALKTIGHKLLAAGRKEEAARNWKNLLQARPDDGDANLELGAILASQGSFVAAIEHFQQAAEHLDSPRLAVHLNLAQAYQKTGQSEQARREFQRSLEIEPNSALAHAGIGLLHAKSLRFGDAAKSFQLAVASQPNHLPHRLNLAAAHLQLNQAGSALEQLEAALRLDPALVTAQVYASQALAELGRPLEAMARMESVVEQQPGDIQAWLRLGELSLRAGDSASAVHSFRQAYRLQPRDSTIQGYLAWILAASPDAQHRSGNEAVELAEAAVAQTERKNPQLLDVLAAAYAESGQFDEAEQTAQEALQLLETGKPQPFADAIRGRLETYRKGLPYRLDLVGSAANTP